MGGTGVGAVTLNQMSRVGSPTEGGEGSCMAGGYLEEEFSR